MRSRFESFLKARWELLLVVLVFVCCTIPHLAYPFYIDEAWVYAPAVKTMAVSGPSLMPGSLSAYYSRGHPLFFHFLCAIWIRCFGSSNIAVHTFPWLVSLAFLIVLYEGSRDLFGRRVATLVLLLVSTQVLFFVQSAFVFPEIMLALFAFLSLYFYAKGRLIATSAMLFMLFFAKENGLVFGAVIGIDAFISLFNVRERIARRLLRLLAVTLPVLLIGGFFVLQKARMGWYILPDHSSLIHADWNSWYSLFRDGLFTIFRGDPGNPILVFLVLLLSVVPAVKNKNARYLFLCLPVTIVYMLTTKSIPGSGGGIIWIVLFIASFAAALYFLFRLANMDGTARKFIILMCICFVLHLCFLSLTMPSYRYLLVNVILMLVFLAVSADAYIAAAGKKFYYIAIAGVLLIGAFAFYADEGNTDADLESFHAMKVEQDVISYLETEGAYDKEIIIGCYFALPNFRDTMSGFLSSRRVFTRVSHDPVGPGMDYAVFDNICGDYDRKRVMGDPHFYLSYKTQNSRSWAEVYKRR